MYMYIDFAKGGKEIFNYHINTLEIELAPLPQEIVCLELYTNTTIS